MRETLARVSEALRELHAVCAAMDAKDQMQRPTESEYQSAMEKAALALKEAA